MAKQERKIITTPAGILKFGHILKPNTKFKATGVYTADIILEPSAPGVQPLLDAIQAAANKAKADFIANETNAAKKKKYAGYAVHVPYGADTDQDGNETGNTVLKAKNDAVITKKDKTTFTKTIAVYDAKGKPMVGKNVGRGSKVKLAIIVAPFKMDATSKVGVTLWLEAVQVLDLVTFGAKDSAGFGFGEEEGYVDDGETPSDTGTGEVAEGSDAPADAF